jgi:hypothetical protein
MATGKPNSSLIDAIIPPAALSRASKERRDMKNIVVGFGLVALLLGGCIGIPYPEHYGAYPQVQYAPQPQVAPVGCIPPYRPSWNGCVLPMYTGYAPMYTGGYYAPMYYYGDPLFRFNFNFGKGGKHHGGGRHHRR